MKEEKKKKTSEGDGDAVEPKKKKAKHSGEPTLSEAPPPMDKEKYIAEKLADESPVKTGPAADAGKTIGLSAS